MNGLISKGRRVSTLSHNSIHTYGAQGTSRVLSRAHMHTAYAGVSHTLPSGCTGHSGSPATPHLLSALFSHSKNICFFHISSAGEIAQGLREAAQCNPDLVLSCWEVWPYMPHISVSIPFSSLSLYCYHKTHVSA